MAERSPSGARFVLRALALGCVLFKHAVRLFFGWLALAVTFAGRTRRRAWFGKVVLDLFRELGATFIKVGQIMSTRPDLIPEYVSNALAELQDHVGPFQFEDVVRAVEADLGRPL